VRSLTFGEREVMKELPRVERRLLKARIAMQEVAMKRELEEIETALRRRACELAGEGHIWLAAPWAAPKRCLVCGAEG
jgi:hypothetical protein